MIKVLEKTFEHLERERIDLERAEEERKAREQAAVEKKAAEEKERLALQKARAERLEKERVEAERLEKERAEAERLENERAEAEKERITKQKEEADSKAKKKADKKAKELAVEEKKAQEKRERIAAEAEILSAKNDTAAFILSAQKAADQGDIDQAVSWYRKAIALAPPELSGVIEKRLKDLDSLETEQTESPQTGEKDEENPARPCPVCGEQIPAGQEVCPHCEGKPKPHQELSSAPGGKNLKATLLGSGIGLIAILGTVLIILGRGGSGPLSSLETGKQTPTGTATSTLIPTATLPPTETPTPTETSTPSVTSTPILGVGSTRVSSKDLMTMAYIPAGVFLMGGEEVYRAPIHEVYLDAFWMDEHEVTYGQYKKFMEEARHYYDVSGEGEDHPAIYISWYGAQAYCEWAGRRLPTEAEWEKAARGELDEKKYPWGDKEPVCDDRAENGAQFSSCDGRSVPVKSFSGNGYGLYDMAGNVYEWVSDWKDSGYYENSPAENPQGPASGYLRVLRGGAWDLQSYKMRVAERDEEYPSDSSYNIGFRCAASE